MPQSLQGSWADAWGSPRGGEQTWVPERVSTDGALLRQRADGQGRGESAASSGVWSKSWTDVPTSDTALHVTECTVKCHPGEGRGNVRFLFSPNPNPR